MPRHAFCCLTAALLVCALAPAPGWAAAQFWLSMTSSAQVGSAPPTTAAGIPFVAHGPNDTSGTLYLWCRPDGTKTLSNWSLRIVSMDPSIVTFNSADAEAYNFDLDPGAANVRRWEYTNSPVSHTELVNFTPANVLGDLTGFTILDLTRTGVGIGSQAAGGAQYPDPNYNAANNAWLLAKVTYTLTGAFGKSDVFLQIGDLGMTHNTEPTTSTSVVFGLTSDPALNAGPGPANGRSKNSLTAEAVIAYGKPNFDIDTDVDGVDYLAWQRNFGRSSNATLAQGDANFDGAVDGFDLAFWQAKFGATGLTPGGTAAPEPLTVFQLTLAAIAALSFRRRLRLTVYAPLRTQTS